MNQETQERVVLTFVTHIFCEDLLKEKDELTALRKIIFYLIFQSEDDDHPSMQAFRDFLLWEYSPVSSSFKNRLRPFMARHHFMVGSDDDGAKVAIHKSFTEHIERLRKEKLEEGVIDKPDDPLHKAIVSVIKYNQLRGLEMEWNGQE